MGKTHRETRDQKSETNHLSSNRIQTKPASFVDTGKQGRSLQAHLTPYCFAVWYCRCSRQRRREAGKGCEIFEETFQGRDLPKCPHPKESLGRGLPGWPAG